MIFRIVVASAFFVLSLNADEGGVKNFTEISKMCEERYELKNGEILTIDDSKPIETDNYFFKCYFKCILVELKLVGYVGIRVSLNISLDVNSFCTKTKEDFQQDYCCKLADDRFSIPESSHMDEDGEILLTGLVNFKNHYWRYIMACLNTTGIDACDKALNLENCIWSKKREDEYH